MKQHADVDPERRLTYEEAVEETGKFDGAASHASIALGKNCNVNLNEMIPL